MNKSDRDVLLALTGIGLFAWLLSQKKKGTCPHCNYPVTETDHTCPNCRQPLNWGGFK